MTERTTIGRLEFRECGELLKKAFIESERTNLLEFHKAGNVASKRVRASEKK